MPDGTSVVISMNKWLKRFIVTAGICLGVIVILWLMLAVYVQADKPNLLKTITRQVNERINGHMEIRNIDLALLRGFPGVSAELKGVVLYDSLWHRHHHALLRAESVYISLNVFSLFKKSPEISEVEVAGATVYLFTDSTGYSNTSVFRKKEKNNKSKGRPAFERVILRNTDFVFENQTKFKMFRIETEMLRAELQYTNEDWSASVSARSFIRDFTFNTEKGSFLKNKKLKADIQIGYNSKNKTLLIPIQSIWLDKDRIQLGGEFYFDRTPAEFSLKITSNYIRYRNALSLLSPNISGKLKVIDLMDPISINASVIGKMKFRDTPLVRVVWNVKNNEFVTPAGNIQKANFTGAFTNQVDTSKGYNDRNSRISLYGFTGKWYDIPVNADSVTVDNLIEPRLKTRIVSAFPLTKLNQVVDADVFSFTAGRADIDLYYCGGLFMSDTTVPELKGHVNVRGLGVKYLPRNLAFQNSDISLLFSGAGVYVQKGILRSRLNELEIRGGVDHLLNFYYKDPKKVVFNWDMRTRSLNLNEFHSFLRAREKNAPKESRSTAGNQAQNTMLQRINSQLDVFLDLCNVNIALKVDELHYRKFGARNIVAGVYMGEDLIRVKDLRVNHADGLVKLNAEILQAARESKIKLKTDIEKVDVQKFFHAMENFQLTSLTDSNIRGTLDARAEVALAISDTGSILPHSMNGAIHFALSNGALIDFEPVKNMGKFIFRRRDLSHITFRDIKNTLELEGDKIRIHPMRIESSVLVLQIEGIYGLKKGTNILIDIPLRNPKKDELILDDSLRAERSMKGIVLHLNAVDDENGKVKFKLIGRQRSAEKKLENQ